jgi:AcrR family transcriptional regulator
MTREKSSKRELQKQETRETIMETALRLYATTGFSTPTSVIAREAGVSHGSVFAHFSTREDLQRAVVRQFSLEVAERLHEIAVSGGSIEDILFAHIDVLEEYEPFYRNLISEMPHLPEGTRTAVFALQSILSQHFSFAVERGKREKTIKDVPLHVFFNTWIALLHYYLQNAELFAPEGAVLKRYRDELVSDYMMLVRI